jgi:hypothetical protein
MPERGSRAEQRHGEENGCGSAHEEAMREALLEVSVWCGEHCHDEVTAQFVQHVEPKHDRYESCIDPNQLKRRHLPVRVARQRSSRINMAALVRTRPQLA